MDLIKEIKKFIKKEKKPIIVILGPTASGKTAISLNIAREIDGEIVSTDSRQIYKEMEIGNDVILPEEQEGIPHHMIGIAKPNKTITLVNYTEMALNIIDEIYKKKHIPMLVGGTGLYISSIIEGYKVPQVPPNKRLRNKLTKDAKEKGNEYVHKMLKKLDHKSAKKIHPNNLRYVIRAIEICKASGKKKDEKNKQKFSPFFVGINRPRKTLYKRIETRVDKQDNRGLIDEVKALQKKGYDESLPAMSSLGVKEIIPYIKGKKKLEECLELLKRNTRRYAKRQETWFKRYENIHWLTPSEARKITKKKSKTK